MRWSTAVSSMGAFMSGLQPHLLVLGLERSQIPLECFVVAPATHALENHCEGPPIARGGAVGVGPVNGLAVVGHRIAGLEADFHFAGLVVGAVVQDTLREAEDSRP